MNSKKHDIMILNKWIYRIIIKKNFDILSKNKEVMAILNYATKLRHSL